MIETFTIKTFSEKEAKKIKDELESQIDAEKKKPFIVSIMGQTGVGKSSLVNALFNTNLKTDPLTPCTKEIECVIAERDGYQLWFYDLPGIGESEEIDTKYIEQYRQTLIKSDIALWAILSDSRSFSCDFNALKQILGSEDESQSQFINKIIFVLTKADLLTPPPWILGVSEKEDYALFIPQDQIEKLLEAKCDYFRNLVINLYKQLSVPESLLESVKVIPCSARFRYNLNKLMLEIVQQMPDTSIFRFEQFHKNQSLMKFKHSELSKLKSLKGFVTKNLDKEV